MFDLFPSSHRLTHLPSNGKVDKRALRTLAENSNNNELLVSKTPCKSSTRQNRPTLRTISMSGVPWSEAESLPLAPPPVYQKEARGSEKAIYEADMRPTSAIATENTMEKGNHLAWEGYEDEALPDKVNSHLLRNLRHQIFTLYRRLFGVVFVVNVAVMIATFTRGNHSAQALGLIVVSNIFCAVLMRQDYVINAFFTIFCSIPPS